MANKQKPDLRYMDLYQKWFEDSIEQGNFERIHRDRVSRDNMVNLYEKEDGYKPAYNPRTRKWE